MNILQYLERWKTSGAITAAQHDVLSALARQDPFSVFVELNALLYLGVVAFVAGAGWTIQTYFSNLGDAAILSSLTIVFCVALYYCFSRSPPYSHAEVESPGFTFDYVLYFGCLVFGLAFGYLEFRFHLLQASWDHYLFLAAAVYFILAYRFDNRFVLSLALSTLAAWFGVRVGIHLSLFGPVFGPESLRPYAIAYGSLVAVAGAGLHRAGIKPHFLETFLHVAANVLFLALLSGVFGRGHEWLYLAALLVLAGLAIVRGVQLRHFAFVVYGVVYGYVGLSERFTDRMSSFTGLMAYIAVSGTIVIVLLVVLARRFGREG
jgi:Predicted membrane protein (DUF2157)